MAGVRTFPGGRLRAAEATLATLEAAALPNWCGRWTLVSGQTAYLWSAATVVSGSATGSATDLDPIHAHVVAAGFPVEPDEYSIEADRLVLASSPPAAAVGEVLTARVYRALT